MSGLAKCKTHSTVALQEVHACFERLNVVTTDFYSVLVPVVGRYDELGYMLKRLCPLIEKPMHRRRRLVKTTYLPASTEPP